MLAVTLNTGCTIGTAGCSASAQEHTAGSSWGLASQPFLIGAGVHAAALSAAASLPTAIAGGLCRLEQLTTDSALASCDADYSSKGRRNITHAHSPFSPCC